jgi:methylenetetrahydrofolate reductase (NADH)
MMCMDTFRDAMQHKDFVISAELPLQPVSTVADIEASVATLATVVDAVQLIDDRAAVGHMSSLAAAAIVLRRDVDAVVHLTGRDRNRVALQAELLGAAALGGTSVVVRRGEKLSRKDYLRGKGVFDTKESRLTEMARRIGEESGLVSAPGFQIGTYVTVFNCEDDWQAERISESIAVGTRVLYTQPCLNVALLRRYMGKLVQRKILHSASVIVEVPLLDSPDLARNYKKDDPKALIPDATIARIVAATDARLEGIQVCAEMLTELAEIPGVSGASIRYDGAASNVVAAITAAGVIGS